MPGVWRGLRQTRNSGPVEQVSVLMRSYVVFIFFFSSAALHIGISSILLANSNRLWSLYLGACHWDIGEGTPMVSEDTGEREKAFGTEGQDEAELYETTWK